MPIARGTVKSCRKNRKGFQLDDGEWYSRMKGEELPVEDWRNDGVTIQVEWFQEGQWKNFTKDPVVEAEASNEAAEGQVEAPTKKGFGPKKSSNSATAPGNSGSYKKTWHAYEDYDYQIEVGHRISRSVALTEAVKTVTDINKDENGNALVVGPETVDLVTTVANLYLEWLSDGAS